MSGAADDLGVFYSPQVLRDLPVWPAASAPPVAAWIGANVRNVRMRPHIPFNLLLCALTAAEAGA